MFFTTKAASKFVRERLETRNRQYSLTKQQQLIFNLQQNNSDYDHCAHLVSISSKEPNPGLKTHSQMCESALREIGSHLEDTTIFSKVNVSICDVMRKKGKIIQDSLKYEFIIDNILNIKRDPKRKKDEPFVSNPVFMHIYDWIFEEVSKKKGSIEVGTWINPASLELVVRTSFDSKVTEPDDSVNSIEKFEWMLNPPSEEIASVASRLIRNSEFNGLLTKWLADTTGYESVKYAIYSGKSKDDNFIKWTFNTRIFFDKDDVINYEEMIGKARRFKYADTVYGKFIGIDGIKPVKFKTLEKNRIYVGNDVTPELRLVTSADLKNKYGIHGELEFKSIYERVFNYINNCLMNNRNVYRYLDDEACAVISVVVPYNEYPEASLTDITGKMCDIYREEGNFIAVKDEHVPDSGLVIFSFFLNESH